jgi:hypothetical protein
MGSLSSLSLFRCLTLPLLLLLRRGGLLERRRTEKSFWLDSFLFTNLGAGILKNTKKMSQISLNRLQYIFNFAINKCIECFHQIAVLLTKRAKLVNESSYSPIDYLANSSVHLAGPEIENIRLSQMQKTLDFIG